MASKILLVTPGFEGISKNKLAKTSEEMHYPVGLAYLHSYLESKKNAVKTLSLNHKTYEESLRITNKCIEEFSPDIIGMQVLTATRISVYKLIENISRNYPGIKIILGGIHATIMYKQLIEKYPFVIVVLGEGEVTMGELSKELLKKKPNLKKIKGIAFSFKKEVVRTERRELIKDLDSLPFPNHKQFIQDKKRKSACLLTTRGCPFACSFCCLNPESKRIVRFRSPKNVVDEIEYIVQNFPHIKSVFIHDDSFFIDNQRVMEICDEIVKEKKKVFLIGSGGLKTFQKK